MSFHGGPGGVTGAILSAIKAITKPLVDTTLDLQIDMLKIINDAILRTPYPGRDEGTIYLFQGPPGDGKWAALYTVHEQVAQPYGFLLLIFSFITALAITPYIKYLPDNKYNREKALKRVVYGFFLITFWWELGSVILAFADSFATLLVDNPAMNNLNEEAANDSCDGDCQGLALTGKIVKDAVQDSFGKGYIFQILMLPILFIYFLVLFALAMLWKLRHIVIFFLMPMMPFIIGMWAFYVPGFTGIADKAGKALNWFVIFAFLAVPGAFLASIGSFIAYQLMQASQESGQNNSSNNSSQILGDAFGQQQSESEATIGTGIFTAYALLIVIPLLAALGPFLLLAKSETLKSTPYGKGLSKLQNTGERAVSETRDTVSTARSVKQGDAYNEAIGVEEEDWKDMSRKEKLQAGGAAGLIGAGLGKSPGAAREAGDRASSAAVSATETAADLRYHGDEIYETKKENYERRARRKAQSTAESVSDFSATETMSDTVSSASDTVKSKTGMKTASDIFEESRQKDSFDIRNDYEDRETLPDDVREAIENENVTEEMMDKYGERITAYINKERFGTRNPDEIDHMGKDILQASSYTEIKGLQTDVQEKLQRLSKEQIVNEYGNLIHPGDLSADSVEEADKGEILNALSTDDILLERARNFQKRADVGEKKKRELQNRTKSQIVDEYGKLINEKNLSADSVEEADKDEVLDAISANDLLIDREEDSLREVAQSSVEGAEAPTGFEDIGEMYEHLSYVNSVDAEGATRKSDKADRTEADNFEDLFSSLNDA